MFQIGDKVKIYYWPLTEEIFEGEAELIKKISSRDKTETWLVKFPSGETAYKTIKR